VFLGFCGRVPGLQVDIGTARRGDSTYREPRFISKTRVKSHGILRGQCLVNQRGRRQVKPLDLHQQ
jgi:hypothetical protein